MVWKWYTEYMMNHSKCDHPATKSARSQCRKEREFQVADQLALQTITWVEKARREGYSNKIHRITVDEIAQERGIHNYNPDLTVQLIVAKVKAVREIDILGKDMRRYL